MRKLIIIATLIGSSSCFCQINKIEVKKVFANYVKETKESRKIQNIKVELIGDLNGDGILDAICYYGLEPTDEEAGAINGMRGNAVQTIYGTVAMIGTKKTFRVVDDSDDFYRCTFKKIVSGVIIAEELTYGDDDPRCCPSVKSLIKIVLRNNKLERL